jgi:hypothetical protein
MDTNSRPSGNGIQMQGTKEIKEAVKKVHKLEKKLVDIK